MKKFLFLLILVAAAGVGLVMTCPDKDAHREAVKDVVSKVVNSEMDRSSIERPLASIGTVLAVNAVDAYLKANLIVRDHTFYNIGVVSYEGDFKMVSVGILNHVFTISEDEAREIIKDKLSLPGK